MSVEVALKGTRLDHPFPIEFLKSRVVVPSLRNQQPSDPNEPNPFLPSEK